jgi:IS5 family transposase
MLWMYFLLQWFNLSDPAVEEALYDSVSMRHFVSIDLGQEPVPDETTVCKFRHLLERHGLGAEIFARVNGYLESRGVTIGTGTAPEAEDRTYRRWRSKLREWPEVREANRIKSKTRSRVEHVFASLKQRFGFVKVRYPGPR